MQAKTAIVTGCRGAIGRAISVELGRAGFRVIGVDRGSGGGHDGPFVDCDLSDAAAIARMLQTVAGITRDVDVLVNNAGVYQPKSFFDVTLADFDDTMAVNARAPFILSQAVSRWMVDGGRRGSIVNIASIAGKLGSPVIPYGTSKAAVIGLTKSLARALAPHGIRVNAVAPGTITSAMSARVAPAQMQAQRAVVPMGRDGDPEEIARVVAFLAQDGSSYMTGSIVDVNGGWPS